MKYIYTKILYCHFNYLNIKYIVFLRRKKNKCLNQTKKAVSLRFMKRLSFYLKFLFIEQSIHLFPNILIDFLFLPYNHRILKALIGSLLSQFYNTLKDLDDC